MFYDVPASLASIAVEAPMVPQIGGLLWFDDDVKHPIKDRILAGMKRFSERTSQTPNFCLVSPADFQAMQFPHGTGKAAKPAMPVEISLPLRVVPSANVRPSHYLIGYDDGLEAHLALAATA
jgi:hypothetical protein